MHISLTPELESCVRRRVESGYYNNASEVIRDALRFWEQNEAIVQQFKLESLRSRLKDGADQARGGQFVRQSIGELIAELKSE
jgi:antitoxin ParD1/3/4